MREVFIKRRSAVVMSVCCLALIAAAYPAHAKTAETAKRARNDQAFHFVVSVSAAEVNRLDRPHSSGDALCSFSGRVAEVYNLQAVKTESARSNFDLGNEIVVQVPCIYDGYLEAPSTFSVPVSATKATSIEFWVDEIQYSDARGASFVPFDAKWQ